MQIKVIMFIKMRLFYIATSFLGSYEIACFSKKIISYTHILIESIVFQRHMSIVLKGT